MLFTMKKLRWQLLVVILALSAIGVLLLSQQQAAILPGVAPAPVEPVSGGMYSEALIGSFGRLNPVLDYYNPADHDVNRLLFSGLLRFDDRGLPQGDLVDTWGVAQDGTSYSFSIRPEANWHDGKPVTSGDVIFTIEMMRSEGVPLPADLRAFWKDVKVEAISEKIVRFQLPEAFTPFLDYLTFGVLPKHLLAGLTPEELVSAPFNLKPVGNGPYRFDHLIVENGQISGVVLSANSDYAPGAPFIDQITFLYYPDAAAALDAYRKGEVMGISQITPEVLSAALKEPQLNVYTGRMPRLGLVYLNLDNPAVPVFKDPEVRHALMQGLNRRGIIDRVLGGQGILADGPIFPESWAYFDGIERPSYDPNSALERLKKAGYTIPAEGGWVRAKDGDALSFELVHPDAAPYPAIAEAIQQDWKRLGVEVNLKAVPYDELLSDYLEPRTYQAALAEINMARSPDPDPYPFWHQAQASGGQNYAQWDDRQASENLELARTQIDVAERTKRYRNFQVRFSLEMPALPLFYPVYSYGVDGQVQGVGMGPIYDPSDRFNSIPAWYLKSGPSTGQVKIVATDTP